MPAKYLLITTVASFCLTPFSTSASPQQSLSLTLGKSTQSLNRVTGQLSNLGYTALSQTGNNRDKAWKLNYQQPMSSLWSANIGWVNLGGNNIQLNGALPAGKTNATAAAEVAASLPIRGWGPTGEVRIHGSPSPNLDMNAGLGLFVYKDNRKATVGNATATRESSGSELFIHFGMDYQLTPNMKVIAEWERYFMDDNVDRLGIGVAYSF